MRIAHKIGVLLAAIALLIVLLLLPRHSQGQSTPDNDSQDVGGYIVHYSAITTNQLLPAIAKEYGIERSDRRGLLNIAVQAKAGAGQDMVRADVSASVGDLTGHQRPIRFRETSENGDYDYLGEFPLTGSGTYVFDVKVIPPGGTRPLTVKFTHDYVVD
jgi:hypothetical protein